MFREQDTVKPIEIALANSALNRVIYGRNNSYIRDEDTVVAILGMRVVEVRTAGRYVIAILPCIRSLTLADRELFGELISLMDTQTQAVDTVAA